MSGEDINYAIILVARRHRYLAGRLFAELGLHPGQEGVLRLLWERDGRTQAELAAALGVEPPTVHRTLVSLEGAGLVRRVGTPRDRRVTLIELTQAGRRLRMPLERAWAELQRATVGDLTPHQVHTLHRLLSRVATNLDVETCDDRSPHRR